MNNDEKKTSIALLSDGQTSFHLFSGVTIIGKEVGSGQFVQIKDDTIESRHGAIRIKCDLGKTSAEIIDFCTEYGTKIEHKLIPIIEWMPLETDNWVTFGSIPLKFSFLPSGDDSDVVSSSTEPIRIRRRCQSMVPQSQTNLLDQSIGLNESKSASFVLANDSQARDRLTFGMDNHTKTNLENNCSDEEVIPETQQFTEQHQSITSHHDAEEDDSEFVFVESETQSEIQNTQMESQIMPVNGSFGANGSSSMIIERSVDTSMNLQLDVTPSQSRANTENDIPDIFKDTEDVADYNMDGMRDETVTPDFDEIEQQENSAYPPAPLSSLASTDSKTSKSEPVITEDESSNGISQEKPKEDIYTAPTQIHKPENQNNSTTENHSYDSDDDIFFAATQKIPNFDAKAQSKSLPISPGSPSIYDIATQQLNHTDEPQQSTYSKRDDNIYEALTQVIPREYLQIPATPIPEQIPDPPSQASSGDTNDSDYTSAQTMVVVSPKDAKIDDKKNENTPTEPTQSSEESVFFDSFSQLNTPDVFNVKLPKPIFFKEEEENTTPPSKETPVTTPQANSTLVKRKIFHQQEAKSKSSPFAHLQDLPNDSSEMNTPDFLNLPSKDAIENSTSTLESNKNDRTYFFEDPIDLTDTQIIEPNISEHDSRTRSGNKSNVNNQEAPKKTERRIAKPKPPSLMPPPLTFPLKVSTPPVLVNSSSIEATKKRSLSTDSMSKLNTSRESTDRKRSKPTKLANDFVTESQMDQYDIEPEEEEKKKKKETKAGTSKLTRLRSVRVVIKPVATVATALPVAISPPEEKVKNDKSNPRKRKARNVIESDSEEEEKQVSPPKLRKTKSERPLKGESHSNEPLLEKVKKTLTDTTRSKRGAKEEDVPVPVKIIHTRKRDALKQKILFTMVSATPYESKIKNTGHSLAQSIDEATVLVTDKIYRSAKFLSAMARGLPIVSVAWLKKLDFDIEKYLICDSIAEERYGFVLRETMEQIRETECIFKDYLVVCSPSTKPQPHEVKQIVESSGGRFSQNCSDLGGRKKGSAGEKVLVVANEEDKSFIKDAKKKYSKIKVVKTEAFMLSVMRNKLVLDKKYLL